MRSTAPRPLGTFEGGRTWALPVPAATLACRDDLIPGRHPPLYEGRAPDPYDVTLGRTTIGEALGVDPAGVCFEPATGGRQSRRKHFVPSTVAPAGDGDVAG